MRLIPLSDIAKYDIFSSDARFLRDDLPRLEPGLGDAPRETRASASGTSDKEPVGRAGEA